MYIPISMDEFIAHHQEANPGADAAAIHKVLTETVRAKKNGVKCQQCGGTIWAAGSAVAGKHGCFTCITGEADSSGDFEIDSVCL